MTEETKFPRRPPRLRPVFQSYDAPLYFVTCCTWNRERILANPDVHMALQEFGKRGHAEKNVALGRYVIMPEHIHFFVSGPHEFILSDYVRMIKICLGKVLSTSKPWQEGFFDHLVRNSESYSQKWDYVRMNPVRAGLVAYPDDWPFQGEIVRILHT
ncbi:MAG: transposase [bacterium]